MDINELYDTIAQSIIHWGKCEALTPVPNGVRFQGGMQDRVAAGNVAAPRSRSVWHVLIWSLLIQYSP